MALHKVMDRTGHTTVKFDTENTIELSEAMERFHALIAEGYTAGTRAKGETDYTVTRDFSTADETLFIPRLKGG